MEQRWIKIQKDKTPADVIIIPVVPPPHYVIYGDAESVGIAYEITEQDDELQSRERGSDGKVLELRFRTGIHIDDIRDYISRLPQRLQSEFINHGLSIRVEVDDGDYT